jgi:outer membrane murein-binding lipoprotein Lpp
MVSSFWIAIAAICVTAILVRGIVSIVAVSKAGGGKNSNRVDDLETQVDKLEGDLEDARNRIEVLEKIVTDKRYGLKQEIDDLAAS